MSDLYSIAPPIILLFVLVVALLSAAVKILREYERAVVFPMPLDVVKPFLELLASAAAVTPA
jgi:hypothetical protein